MDELFTIIALGLGIFFAAVLIITMQGLFSGEWTIIGQTVASLVLVITGFAITLLALIKLLR